jgi:hypothetical protein
MSDVTVLTIGYYNYTMDQDTAAVILAAAAAGKIKTVEKKYINGDYQAVVGKPISVDAQVIPEVSDRDAQLAELKERLKKLEAQ